MSHQCSASLIKGSCKQQSAVCEVGSSHLLRSHTWRQHQPLVIPMRHNHDSEAASGQAPAVLPAPPQPPPQGMHSRRSTTPAAWTSLQDSSLAATSTRKELHKKGKGNLCPHSIVPSWPGSVQVHSLCCCGGTVAQLLGPLQPACCSSCCFDPAAGQPASRTHTYANLHTLSFHHSDHNNVDRAGGRICC